MFWIVGALIGIIGYLIYEISVYDKKMQEIKNRIVAINEKFETFYGDGR